MKDLPKYHETFVPILKVLNDRGVLYYNDLRKIVRDEFYSDLSEELLAQKTKTGDLVILNRIGWGKAYLKMGGFIDQPERGYVKITNKGKGVLEKGIFTLSDLQNDPDFQTHRGRKNKEDASEQVENDTPEDKIDSGIQEIEDSVKQELLEKLKNMDPYLFEKVILQLLHKMGYGDFIETAKSGDGGIDGIINQDELGLEKIYMQAKRFTENKVRETDIRNFIGAMSGDTQKGIFVTTSKFDDNAIQKARDAHHTIILIDGDRLTNLMYQHSIGVQIKNVYEVKTVDEDFFEE